MPRVAGDQDDFQGESVSGNQGVEWSVIDAVQRTPGSARRMGGLACVFGSEYRMWKLASWVRWGAAFGAAIASYGGVSSAAAWSCGGGEAGVDFTYPSAESPRVPANAIFWVVPNGYSRVHGMYLDGSVSVNARGTSGVDALTFAPSAPLQLGSHELELALQSDVGPDAIVVIPFEVIEESGPALARPVAVQPLVATRYEWSGLNYEQLVNQSAELARVASLPGDCTFFAEHQHFACNYNDLIGQNFRIEFEATGDVLGFFVSDRWFLPATCRATFLPVGTVAYEIYPVMPTGLGAPARFEQIEQYAPEGSELPRHVPGWCATGAPGARAANNAWTVGLVLGLGLLARRKGRSKRDDGAHALLTDARNSCKMAAMVSPCGSSRTPLANP